MLKDVAILGLRHALHELGGGGVVGITHCHLVRYLRQHESPVKKHSVQNFSLKVAERTRFGKTPCAFRYLRMSISQLGRAFLTRSLIDGILKSL